jgi:protein involved in polysaccharide export with SLBB domain
MSGEMQRRMTGARAGILIRAVALGSALGVAALGCAHRSSTTRSPAAVAALQPAAAPAPGPAYRIQLGDELHVRFLYQPDMNEQVPVRPDGRISLASTGELEVVGVTPTELERLIIERSSTRLRNPEVTVIVTKLGEQRVYVGGEVARPGQVVLRPDMTPLQAVLQSGGFKDTAKLNSVLILTPGPDGRFAAARVDMKQVVDDGVAERVRLHPNDVIYVPATWIADMNVVVDQYVRGLIPSLPRVGAGYSLSNSN